MKEINLFESYLSVPSQKRKLYRTVKLVAVMALVVYCVAAAGVFSYWFLLRGRSQSLDSKIESQQSEIVKLKDEESLHVLIKERLKVLSAEEVLSRPDLDLILTDFVGVLPAGVWYESFDVGSEGEVGLSGGASDAVALSAFINNLIDLGEAKKESWVEFENTSRDTDGQYSFSVKSYAR